MKRLFCLLLAIILMISFDTVAIGEKCYTIIKTSISQSNETGHSEDLNTYASLWGKLVTLSFHAWNNEVVLIGKNDADHLEVTIWQYDDNTAFLGLLGAYCALWDTLNGVLDKGYKLTIELQSEENGEIAVIDTAEKADMLFGLVLDTMGLN